MKRRASHVGRLRIQAAEILSRGLGFVVDPTDIQPATGSYRTCPYHDVYRWELFTTKPNGLALVAGCWWTLTDFVKHAKIDGFHIYCDEIYPGRADDERVKL